MKVILLLAGYGTRMRPHTWSRPKALMKVAGNTVIGHLLDKMADVLTEEVIFVVGYKGKQIEAWIRENYPHLDTHFVVQKDALGQAHAVALCREFLEDDGEIVVGFGDGIVQADYASFNTLAGDIADAVLTVEEIEDPRSFGVVKMNDDGFVSEFIEKPKTKENKLAAAGINWFRSSKQLMEAIDTIIKENIQTLGEFYMADAYRVMLREGRKMRILPVEYWLDAGKPLNILHTNKRMLSMGHGSPDAIERGFGEGFTVVPPVWIHDSAEIEASVIGPYVHVGANAKISHAIVRNSIIDPDAIIANCALDGALIGEQAQVTGKSSAMFVGDKSIIRLG